MLSILYYNNNNNNIFTYIMRHSFKTSSGKPAFGGFKEPLYAGDYTYNKKAKSTYCKANVCVPNRSVTNHNDLLLLKRANYLKYYSCKNSFNTANLNINLLTTLDLSGVDVLINSNADHTNYHGAISTSDIPYLNYTIDPCGNLFGYTACGLNNYEMYLRYNPPPTPPNSLN